MADIHEVPALQSTEFFKHPTGRAKRTLEPQEAGRIPQLRNHVTMQVLTLKIIQVI